MEEEIMEEKSKIQASWQTKKYVNVNEREEKMKEFFKNLHLQRSKWRHDIRNALCCSFQCVNDNKLVLSIFN